VSQTRRRRFRGWSDEERRSAGAVVALSIIALGIYAIYWMVATKGEMNSQGASIPTAWLIIVPIANIWWTWRYAEGVGRVTSGGMSAGSAFLLLWLLSLIGMAIVQPAFNKVARS